MRKLLGWVNLFFSLYSNFSYTTSFFKLKLEKRVNFTFFSYYLRFENDSQVTIQKSNQWKPFLSQLLLSSLSTSKPSLVTKRIVVLRKDALLTTSPPIPPNAQLSQAVSPLSNVLPKLTAITPSPNPHAAATSPNPLALMTSLSPNIALGNSYLSPLSTVAKKLLASNIAVILVPARRMTKSAVVMITVWKKNGALLLGTNLTLLARNVGIYPRALPAAPTATNLWEITGREALVNDFSEQKSQRISKLVVL